MTLKVSPGPASFAPQAETLPVIEAAPSTPSAPVDAMETPALVLKATGPLLEIARPPPTFWNPTGRTPDRYSTILTNERNHHLFSKAFEAGPSGGTFIGLGSTQCYTMFALAKSKRMAIYDGNPRQIALHQMFGLLFQEASTPAAMVAAFAPAAREANQAALESRAKGLGALYREQAEQLYDELRKMKGNSESPTFMSKAELFQRVRAAFLEGRVSLRIGDHSTQDTLRILGDEVRGRGEQVDYVYVSNAILPRYGSTKKKFREGLRSLPLAKGAMVLASRDFREVLGAPKLPEIQCGSTVGSSAWFYWDMAAAGVKDVAEALGGHVPSDDPMGVAAPVVNGLLAVLRFALKPFFSTR